MQINIFFHNALLMTVVSYVYIMMMIIIIIMWFCVFYSLCNSIVLLVVLLVVYLFFWSLYITTMIKYIFNENERCRGVKTQKAYEQGWEANIEQSTSI